MKTVGNETTERLNAKASDLAKEMALVASYVGKDVQLLADELGNGTNMNYRLVFNTAFSLVEALKKVENFADEVAKVKGDPI